MGIEGLHEVLESCMTVKHIGEYAVCTMVVDGASSCFPETPRILLIAPCWWSVLRASCILLSMVSCAYVTGASADQRGQLTLFLWWLGNGWLCRVVHYCAAENCRGEDTDK